MRFWCGAGCYHFPCCIGASVAPKVLFGESAIGFRRMFLWAPEMVTCVCSNPVLELISASLDLSSGGAVARHVGLEHAARCRPRVWQSGNIVCQTGLITQQIHSPRQRLK